MAETKDDGAVPGSSIRIVIADDFEMTRDGWAMILDREPGLSVVGVGRNGRDAIDLYRQHRPDVALIDLQMPVMDGASATEAIIRAFPDARVVLFTTFDGDEDISRGLRAGARGYILKDAKREDVIAAVREVAAGRRFLPPIVSERLAERLEMVPLTGRELEVLQSLSDGVSNKEIGYRLGISEGTVKAHVNAITTKLQATSRSDAVLIATRRGLLRGNRMG